MTDEDKELKLYTVPEVAKMFEVTVGTVRAWINKGDLPAIKVGKSFRIPHKDLVAFTQARYV